MVNEMRIALSVALNIHSGGSTHGSEGNEDKVRQRQGVPTRRREGSTEAFTEAVLYWTFGEMRNEALAAKHRNK